MRSIAANISFFQCISELAENIKDSLFLLVKSISDRKDSDYTSHRDNCRDMANVQAERLLDTYGNSILRLAYTYLHNMADAEDVLQDTLIQYIKAAPAFENPVHEKAWLLKVAGNLSKNKIKYNNIRMSDELSDNLEAQGETDLSFVWDAVKQLPVKYREVVHLYYYEGYSSLEVAKILGRNESTIRSDLKRGREKLKEILKEGYDFE